MAQWRKTTFSLGGPEYINDPRVDEAVALGRLALEQQQMALRQRGAPGGMRRQDLGALQDLLYDRQQQAAAAADPYVPIDMRPAPDMTWSMPNGPAGRGPARPTGPVAAGSTDPAAEVGRYAERDQGAFPAQAPGGPPRAPAGPGGGGGGGGGGGPRDARPYVNYALERQQEREQQQALDARAREQQEATARRQREDDERAAALGRRAQEEARRAEAGGVGAAGADFLRRSLQIPDDPDVEAAPMYGMSPLNWIFGRKITPESSRSSADVQRMGDVIQQMLSGANGQYAVTTPEELDALVRAAQAMLGTEFGKAIDAQKDEAWFFPNNTDELTAAQRALGEILEREAQAVRKRVDPLGAQIADMERALRSSQGNPQMQAQLQAQLQALQSARQAQRGGGQPGAAPGAPASTQPASPQRSPEEDARAALELERRMADLADDSSPELKAARRQARAAHDAQEAKRIRDELAASGFAPPGEAEAALARFLATGERPGVQGERGLRQEQARTQGIDDLVLAQELARWGDSRRLDAMRGARADGFWPGYEQGAPMPEGWAIKPPPRGRMSVTPSLGSSEDAALALGRLLAARPAAPRSPGAGGGFLAGR